MAARLVLTDVEHLPLTRAGALTEREAEVIGGLTEIYDASVRAARGFHPSLCETDGCAALHQPVAALCAYHAKAGTSGDGELIMGVAKRIVGQMLAERKQLAVGLADLDVWCSAAAQALHDAQHMPLTRSGVLSDSERAAMGTLLELSSFRRQARTLLDPASCRAGACRDLHRSGELLGRF
ncbi:MAG TPA: hypothetical protein VI365_22360, partial [Trebonia sp.]